MVQMYRVRSHGIASETIDGETIVLNLGTGTYFSLSGAAQAAWPLIEQGASAPQIAARLRSRYASDGGAIEDAVAAFIQELLREQVIEPVFDVAPTIPPAETNAAPEPFAGLSIHRYTDIQELLLIDPVHEVDERGWPARPGQG